MTKAQEKVTLTL